MLNLHELLMLTLIHYVEDVVAGTLIAYSGRYMVVRLPQTTELSTDLHWRINYIQCCVPLILE